MASQDHVDWLKGGVDAWNKRRRETPFVPDLRNVDLSGLQISGLNLETAKLDGAVLCGANLHSVRLAGASLSAAKLQGSNLMHAIIAGGSLKQADLCQATLSGADLAGADLSGADLRDAVLVQTNFSDASLVRARLRGAHLRSATLVRTDLSYADMRQVQLDYAILMSNTLRQTELSQARLVQTCFSNVNLGEAIGLETVEHRGPSILDHRTLQKSRNLPLAFLRGAGLPDILIHYLPSIFGTPIELYSCFISYSHRDNDFVARLHADLQDNGVRCWFAPHDLPIGRLILDEIDTAIRIRDRLLLVLSQHSILSDWVQDEVTTAFEEERKRGQPVLFPIRLDDAIMETSKA
jgi:uncharacterized protein YjbI with pentapeptide repeats